MAAPIYEGLWLGGMLTMDCSWQWAFGSTPRRMYGDHRPGVLCLCVLTILVDTSNVNVTLPTLTRELEASTRDLMWIVDACNLAFAGFVLAAGSLGDRLGRKRILMIGLAVFGTASSVGSLMTHVGSLIACRAVMGSAQRGSPRRRCRS